MGPASDGGRRGCGEPTTVVAGFVAATLVTLAALSLSGTASGAPARMFGTSIARTIDDREIRMAVADRGADNLPDAWSVATRMCSTLLREIGFARFQQRFALPEECPDAVSPDARAATVDCAQATDPAACIDARVEAIGKEHTTSSTYTTMDGSLVRIVVSRGYEAAPVDQAYWADFLAGLVHGAELSTVTLQLTPTVDIAAACGPGALACYRTNTETIIAAPTDQPGAPTAESLVAHEYGHHVANTQHAGDRGTARWATYMRICQRLHARELITDATWGPGYRLNPAEGFAEAYRVLNERRLGGPEAPWMLVDRRFYPDAAALRALEEDVRAPWTSPTAITIRGRGSRTFRIQTPVDGAVHVALSSVRGAYRVSAPTEVCGQRNILVNVHRLRGDARFVLRISRP